LRHLLERGALLALLLPTWATAAPVERVCNSFDADHPTVLLALDGVPHGAMLRARERGAFASWPEPRPLVSTFPSMTNVGFTAILGPLGVEPIAGYEVPHFDHDRNSMVGISPFKVKQLAYGWRFVIEKEIGGGLSHLSNYAAPRRKALRELEVVEGKILANTRDLLVVYVAATDSLTHFRGESALVRFLLDLDQRLEEMQARLLQRENRCARLILLSDHGNTEQKVYQVKGLRRLLRRSGFRISSSIESPLDVVAPTFGVVNYGALYLADEKAPAAARTISEHPAVDLATYLSSPNQIRIVDRQGAATIEWRDAEEGLRYRYVVESADPLEMKEVVSGLADSGLLDDDGFASATSWLLQSAEGRYPNAPQRIVDSLTGTWVRHSATVLFSIEPGYAWGRRIAYYAAGLKGGHLEGTHGGLDSISSVGIFMTNDPAIDPGRAISAAEALSFIPATRNPAAVHSPTGTGR
jgi:hypothetical protein